MTDKELLELAANAAGCSYSQVEDIWNPLTDDGDALRLAVKLNIVVWECAQYNRAMAFVRHGSASGEYWELVGEDPCAATRRAIVKAAAEIGKQNAGK